MLKRNLLNIFYMIWWLPTEGVFLLSSQLDMVSTFQVSFYFIFTKAESQDDIRGNEFAPKRHYKGYGITGCGVFKTGIQNWKGFCIKINCSQMKLLNFENWTITGSLSSLQKSEFLKLIILIFHEKKTEKLVGIRCQGNACNFQFL